jgi:hypothetical protein
VAQELYSNYSLQKSSNHLAQESFKSHDEKPDTLTLKSHEGVKVVFSFKYINLKNDTLLIFEITLIFLNFCAFLTALEKKKKHFKETSFQVTIQKLQNSKTRTKL